MQHLKLLLLIIFFILIMPEEPHPASTLKKLETYEKTRNLLRSMELDSGNRALKKLFKTGEKRLPDLIKALSEPDQKIQINTQIIIRYLGIPEGIAAIGSWMEYQQLHKQSYCYPLGIKNFTAYNGRILIGDEKKPEKLVLQNAYFLIQGNKQGISARIIAYNEKGDKALVEVTDDCPLCGECWHVSVIHENGRWRYLATGMIWIS